MTTDERAGLESDPIVPYADPADLPAPLRSATESYRQRMGFLPNALKLYMYRPQILKCLIEINNTIMRDASGHLDEGLERRIAAVCSALNHSPCCVAHNANTLKSSVEGEGEGWGWSDAEVRALLDPGFEPDDPVEAACFAFARAATRDPSDVPQTVIARLTEALTPPQVIELACVVGFWRMYDSIHESLYVPVEDELPGGRDFNPDELLREAKAGAAPPRPRRDDAVMVEVYVKAEREAVSTPPRLRRNGPVGKTEPRAHTGGRGGSGAYESKVAGGEGEVNSFSSRRHVRGGVFARHASRASSSVG